MVLARPTNVLGARISGATVKRAGHRQAISTIRTSSERMNSSIFASLSGLNPIWPPMCAAFRPENFTVGWNTATLQQAPRPWRTFELLPDMWSPSTFGFGASATSLGGVEGTSLRKSMPANYADSPLGSSTAATHLQNTNANRFLL